VHFWPVLQLLMGHLLPLMNNRMEPATFRLGNCQQIIRRIVVHLPAYRLGWLLRLVMVKRRVRPARLSTPRMVFSRVSVSLVVRMYLPADPIEIFLRQQRCGIQIPNAGQRLEVCPVMGAILPPRQTGQLTKRRCPHQTGSLTIWSCRRNKNCLCLLSRVDRRLEWHYLLQLRHPTLMSC